MELPFTIKFFKKLEYFQTLERLDLKEKHQEDGLWEIEKKTLRWTYWGHKHLGSSLFEYDLFNEQEAKKRKFAYHLVICRNGLNNEKDLGTNHDNNLHYGKKLLDFFNKEGFNCFLCLIEKRDDEQIQTLKNQLKIEGEIDNDLKTIWFNLIKNLKDVKIDKYKPKLNNLKIKEEDIEKVGRDKILENLVSKGFASYKNIKDITDGILITESGLTMGEVIWEIYNTNKTASLAKNKFMFYFYKAFIALGWAVLYLGFILLIKEVSNHTVLFRTININKFGIEFTITFWGIFSVVLFIAMVVVFWKKDKILKSKE